MELQLYCPSTRVSRRATVLQLRPTGQRVSWNYRTDLITIPNNSIFLRYFIRFEQICVYAFKQIHLFLPKLHFKIMVKNTVEVFLACFADMFKT